MQQQEALRVEPVMGYRRITEVTPLRRTNLPIETVPYLQSVIPPNRLEYLVETCRSALQHRPGHVLEIGVYRGGSLSRLAEVVAEMCPEYRAIGIDTFSGHPYSDGHPVHPQGKYHDVDLRELARQLAQQPQGRLVELHSGRVEDILHSLALKDVAFAHVDCDLYLPVRYCAEHLPAIMKAGGTIYFDDYGHEHCPGATRAVDDVFASNDLHEVTMPDDGTCWSCHLRIPE
jgi:O-methyltransferase